MGSKSAYLSKKSLDHLLGGATYAQPSTVYMALSTAAFTPNATGTSMNECTGGSYARLSLPNDNTTFTAASTGSPSTKSNINDLAMVTATASWGTPMSVYLVDASSGGNVLFGADLGDTAEVATGDTFKILAGTFVFSEH